MFWLQLVNGIALAATRLSGDRSQAFQAIAHLFVGGWIGYAAAKPSDWKRYVALAIAVSLVELYAFLAGVGH